MDDLKHKHVYADCLSPRLFEMNFTADIRSPEKLP